jgi:hypothetical protein
MKRYPGIYVIKGLEGNEENETIIYSLEEPRPKI